MRGQILKPLIVLKLLTTNSINPTNIKALTTTSGGYGVLWGTVLMNVGILKWRNI